MFLGLPRFLRGGRFGVIGTPGVPYVAFRLVIDKISGGVISGAGTAGGGPATTAQCTSKSENDMALPSLCVVSVSVDVSVDVDVPSSSSSAPSPAFMRLRAYFPAFCHSIVAER